MNVEYLDRAQAVLEKHFRPNDPSGSMTAASAAFAIKNGAGEFHTVGFPKFKDVLDALEGRGFLRQGLNSKRALAVWLTNGNSAKSTPAEKSTRLTKEVWFAFVGKSPEGARFLHPRTGAIRVGCEHDLPAPWVRIDTVDPGADKCRAREFLKANCVEAEVFEPILLSDSWYTEFPKKLAANLPRLASEWNRSRSAWVTEHVLSWCEKNSVLPNRVLEPALIQTSRPGNAVVELPHDELRRVLLEAIAKMTTEELLSIPIQATHIVAALRPDLIR